MDWLLPQSDASEQAKLMALELYLFADLDLSEYHAPPALDHLRIDTAKRRYQTRGAAVTLPSQFGNLEQYLSY